VPRKARELCHENCVGVRGKRPFIRGNEAGNLTYETSDTANFFSDV